MNIKGITLALAGTMSFAAHAQIVGQYATYTTPTAHVTYDASAPDSNFGAPTNLTQNSSYDIYLTSDSSYVYGLVQASGDAPTVAPFANLYFDLDPNNPNDGGSDLGFELSPNGADVFIPGPGDNTVVTNILTYSANASSLEFAIPVSYFNEKFGDLPYYNNTIIPTEGGDVRLNLSQTFGYSVAGGQAYYGDSRLGEVEVPAAAAVPEPASWAMMVGGFGLIGGALRRKRRTLVRFA